MRHVLCTHPPSYQTESQTETKFWCRLWTLAGSDKSKLKSKSAEENLPGGEMIPLDSSWYLRSVSVSSGRHQNSRHLQLLSPNAVNVEHWLQVRVISTQVQVESRVRVLDLSITTLHLLPSGSTTVERSQSSLTWLPIALQAMQRQCGTMAAPQLF